MNVAQSRPFEVTAEMATTGLLAVARFRIDDNQGNTVVASRAFDRELGTTGTYAADAAAIATLGQYTIIGTFDGSYDPDTVMTEELVIYDAGSPPLSPVAAVGIGPCQLWVTTDDIADCCPGYTGGTDTAALEAYAPFASDILYEATGSLYAGECGPVTVRPEGAGYCSCFTSIVSGWSWDRLSNRWAYGSSACGCRPVSEVLLAGWPREVTEVRIDGVALSPTEYRLDGFKLVRMRDPLEPKVRLMWPGCQIMDLDDTEPGTFAVDYTYGLDPPAGAAAAAAALACQLWAACNPDSLGEGECELPSNVRQVARAGLTIEFGNLVLEALRGGHTGIAAIDLFLAAHGDDGDGSQPSVWSPDIDPYPRRVGQLGT